MTKEALKMALEALEQVRDANILGLTLTQNYHDAITAIKVSLETKDKQMKTDEDDEFDRIEHESKMRSGQPYHWDVFVSPSQRNQVLEEVAKEIEKMTAFGKDTIGSFTAYIRGMKK